MVTVPRYTQQIIERPIAAPAYSPSATPESFGAQIGRHAGSVAQSLGGVSDAMVKKELESQERLARADVRSAVNEARSDVRQYTSDIYQKKGKEATDVYNEANTALSQIRSDYAGKLKTEDQKAMFSATFDSIANGNLNRVQAFQEKSRNEYEENTLDAENLQALDDAVSARNDPSEIKNSESTIAANTRYKYRGQDKKVIDYQVDRALDNLHSKIISAKGEDSPADALEYFKENKDKINPTLRAQLDSKLKSLKSSQDAYTLVDDGLNRGLPEEEIRAKINAVNNPDMRKIARTELDYRLSVKKREERDASEKTLNEMWVELDRTNDPAAIPKNIAFGEQVKMREYITRKMDGSFKPDIGLYERLRDEAYTDPRKFLNRNISEQYPVLGQGYTNTLLKLKTSVQNKGKSKQANDDLVRGQTYNSYQSDFIRSIGFNAKNPEEATKSAKVRQLFDSEVNKYPAEQRDKIETWNKVRDTMSMTVESSGFLGIFDHESKLYQAELAGVEYEPKEVPESIPQKATWINNNVGGTPVKGWNYQNKYGTSLVYSTDGTMYRWDIPSTIASADSAKPVGKITAIGRWR